MSQFKLETPLTAKTAPENRMRILDTLKRLTARGPSPWPVLSVYVNTRPNGPQMATYRPSFKKRMTEELKAFAARTPEHESLVVDFSRVQHYLDYDLKESTRAAAVFACYADDDMFDAIQVPRELAGNLVTVGPLPTLFPLIQVADRSRRAAVLVTDTNAARLFVISLGAIEIRREVRGIALHEGKQAGDHDESSLQAHVEEVSRRHARLAAQALEELIHESPVSWIVLAGEAEIVATLRGFIAPALQERLLDRQAWDIRIREADLSAHVERLVEERECAIREERARSLIDRAGEGETVIGLQPVIVALRDSRVGELVMSEDFPAEGLAWACRNCRSFDAGPLPVACPACASGAVQIVPLREELAARAHGLGAAVHFVEAGAAADFDARGGIGAELRY